MGGTPEGPPEPWRQPSEPAATVSQRVGGVPGLGSSPHPYLSTAHSNLEVSSTALWNKASDLRACCGV